MRVYYSRDGVLLESGVIRCGQCEKPVRVRVAGGDVFVTCECWEDDGDE